MYRSPPQSGPTSVVVAAARASCGGTGGYEGIPLPWQMVLAPVLFLHSTLGAAAYFFGGRRQNSSGGGGRPGGDWTRRCNGREVAEDGGGGGCRLLEGRAGRCRRPGKGAALYPGVGARANDSRGCEAEGRDGGRGSDGCLEGGRREGIGGQWRRGADRSWRRPYDVGIDSGGGGES